MEKVSFLMYEAPVVEVVEVQVEKGFEGSISNVPVWDSSYDFQ